MATTYRRNVGDGLKAVFRNLFQGRKLDRGAAWGLMIIGALLSFEVFNFSTTQFALRDVLGDLSFAGLRWATILAIAFCGIDFAGIARIFTPEQGRDEPAEVYYLFGAWLLAAGFNATLTWWGVSVAIAENGAVSSGALSPETMTKVVPIFVAAMVWLVRVLIIGTFSLAGDRLFTTAAQHVPFKERPQAPQYQQPRTSYNSNQTQRPASSYHSQSAQSQRPVNQPILQPASQISRPQNQTVRPAPKPVSSQQSSFIPAEPTYHTLNYSARGSENSERHYDA
jgi:hypothetical protein